MLERFRIKEPSSNNMPTFDSQSFSFHSQKNIRSFTMQVSVLVYFCVALLCVSQINGEKVKGEENDEKNVEKRTVGGVVYATKAPVYGKSVTPSVAYSANTVYSATPSPVYASPAPAYTSSVYASPAPAYASPAPAYASPAPAYASPSPAYATAGPIYASPTPAYASSAPLSAYATKIGYAAPKAVAYTPQLSYQGPQQFDYSVIPAKQYSTAPAAPLALTHYMPEHQHYAYAPQPAAVKFSYVQPYQPYTAPSKVVSPQHVAYTYEQQPQVVYAAQPAVKVGYAQPVYAKVQSPAVHVSVAPHSHEYSQPITKIGYATPAAATTYASAPAAIHYSPASAVSQFSYVSPHVSYNSNGLLSQTSFVTKDGVAYQTTAPAAGFYAPHQQVAYAAPVAPAAPSHLTKIGYASPGVAAYTAQYDH